MLDGEALAVEFDRLFAEVRRPSPAAAGWVRSYEGQGEHAGDYLDHFGGVDWVDAPLPRRRHRCRPQSRGRFGLLGRLVERCACGATRLDGEAPWFERNSRRRADG